MMNVVDVILYEINELIDNDWLVLLMLFEVVLWVREIVEDFNVLVSDLVKVINNDVVMMVWIIKVVNSFIMWGVCEIEDV